MQTIYRVTQWVSILAGTVLLTAAGVAAECRITIRDYVGWGFPPDLVNYSFRASKSELKRLRVSGPDGTPLAVQTSADADGGATVSFVAQVPPDGTVTYTVCEDGKGVVPATAVKTRKEGMTLVLDNGILAIQMPLPDSKRFKQPVPANTLPCPILSFRCGSGPWLGAARMLDSRPVSEFRVTQTADGPVFAEVVCEYRYGDGGHYRARVQVIDQVPVAKVWEEYDAKALRVEGAAWELDLAKGWVPDTIERYDEHGGKGVAIADLLKNRPTVGSPGSAGERMLGTEPDMIVFPSYFWHRLGATYVGLWRDADRQAASAAFPRVGFLPLHKGQWRVMNGLKVALGNGAVRVQLPLSARHATWHEDSASYTSPFSIGQRDPNLPRTLGRRVWGLMLAPVPDSAAAAHAPADGNPAEPPKTWRDLAAAAPGRSNASAVFWRARHWYGTIGLDRYKDYVLEWPDKTSPAAYPRVFNTRQDLERFKGVFDKLPKDQQTALKQLWGYTGDPKVAAEQVGRIRQTLRDSRRFRLAFDCSWYGHHDMWGQSQFWADDVLAWPDMPDADRRELRALLALGAYVLTEPDVVSAGIGDHTGNPNMSVSRQLSFANFAALLPDHPLRDTWARYMGEFTEYKLAENQTPGGGWFEFGGYHTHGFYGPVRGFPGQVALKSPNLDRIWKYIRDDMDYVVNLFTPVDPRYGARVVPGGANSPNMPYGHFGEWSAVASMKDADFAANLRWAFDMTGKSFGSTDYGGPIMAFDRPWLAPKEPALKSEIYPGVGVVFRAHQGPEETYLYFRAGYCWSHWYVDQGHFVLYGKGYPLMPGQHYQYYSPKDKTHNMYNTIRFGHPENEFAYAWPDGNVLDHAFGPRVDYAWASMGYPDWYVNPGFPPGFGEPRKVTDIPGQKEGAFHWNRQAMFLKGATGKSPNYFVFRDTFPGDAASNPEPAGKLASYLNLNFVGRAKSVNQSDCHLAVDTDWPVKLDVMVAGEAPQAAELIEEGKAAPTYAFYTDTPVVPPVTSRYWVDPVSGHPVTKLLSGVGLMEQRVLAVLAREPGKDYLWMLFPRAEGEALPPAVQLAPGAMKITTSESTDYVFLSTRGMRYDGEEVTFDGGAGAVRLGKDGMVTLAMVGGVGKVGYKGFVVEGTAPFERTVKAAELKAGTEKTSATASMGYAPQLKDHQEAGPGLRKAVAGDVTEYLVESAAPVLAADGNVRIEARRAAIHVSPAGIRFVAPERTFVQLTVGNQGVRGVGPFDLTFTVDKIAGTVDGDTRTLVATRPPKVVKPMYHQDGWRYYAGHADDSSCDDGRATPQFNVALGVTAGRHQVEVAEWSFPSLPPTVARKVIP
jgi:hypothetical protein